MKAFDSGSLRTCLVGGVVVLAAVGIAASGNPVAAAAEPPPGAVLFASSGCVQCHGPAGLGTERGPSLRDVRKHMNEAQVQHQIKEGGQAMPPFSEVLTDVQIKTLAEFLRGKKAWEKPLPVVAPASAPRD